MKQLMTILAALLVVIPTTVSRVRAEQEGRQPAMKGKLMFFMNPHGMPCKMQDKIIVDAGKDITDAAEVVYVKTTAASDRKLFYQYGIRALPSLILVDPEGNPVHRFPPGIQSTENIAKALGKLK